MILINFVGGLCNPCFFSIMNISASRYFNRPVDLNFGPKTAKTSTLVRNDGPRFTVWILNILIGFIGGLYILLYDRVSSKHTKPFGTYLGFKRD